MPNKTTYIHVEHEHAYQSFINLILHIFFINNTIASCNPDIRATCLYKLICLYKQKYPYLITRLQSYLIIYILHLNQHLPFLFTIQTNTNTPIQAQKSTRSRHDFSQCKAREGRCHASKILLPHQSTSQTLGRKTNAFQSFEDHQHSDRWNNDRQPRTHRHRQDHTLHEKGIRRFSASKPFKTSMHFISYELDINHHRQYANSQHNKSCDLWEWTKCQCGYHSDLDIIQTSKTTRWQAKQSVRHIGMN